MWNGTSFMGSWRAIVFKTIHILWVINSVFISAIIFQWETWKCYEVNSYFNLAAFKMHFSKWFSLASAYWIRAGRVIYYSHKVAFTFILYLSQSLQYLICLSLPVTQCCQKHISQPSVLNFSIFLKLQIIAIALGSSTCLSGVLGVFQFFSFGKVCALAFPLTVLPLALLSWYFQRTN